jgi:large subunit ribosomal protein L6
MSRIGKLPITIPENVDINCNDSEIIVKGKFGTLQTKIPDEINITQTNETLRVNLKEETRNVRSLHGLYRTLINNMVIGVSKQFD